MILKTTFFCILKRYYYHYAKPQSPNIQRAQNIPAVTPSHLSPSNMPNHRHPVTYTRSHSLSLALNSRRCISLLSLAYLLARASLSSFSLSLSLCTLEAIHLASYDSRTFYSASFPRLLLRFFGYRDNARKRERERESHTDCQLGDDSKAFTSLVSVRVRDDGREFGRVVCTSGKWHFLYG